MTFIEFVQQNSTQMTLSSGSHLFYQGKVDTHLYYVQSGLFKAYYLSPDGTERIKSFIETGDVIASMQAVYAKTTCSFSLMALTEVSVLSIPFELLNQHSQTDIVLAQDMIQILLKFAMKKEQREYELLTLTPEQRFAKLIQESGDLMQRVTQNDLARYLGITAVGLSRIKTRLLKPV